MRFFYPKCLFLPEISLLSNFIFFCNPSVQKKAENPKILVSKAFNSNILTFFRVEKSFRCEFLKSQRIFTKMQTPPPCWYNFSQMAKNSNCKKSWHPTRFEQQNRIEQFKKRQEEKKRRKRISFIDKKFNKTERKTFKRLDWMYEK